MRDQFDFFTENRVAPDVTVRADSHTGA
jgi:hypothetical protein